MREWLTSVLVWWGKEQIGEGGNKCMQSNNNGNEENNKIHMQFGEMCDGNEVNSKEEEEEDQERL